jgi:hypothetical protein
MGVLSGTWKLFPCFHRVSLSVALFVCLFLSHTATAEDNPSRRVRLLIQTPQGVSLMYSAV